MKMSLASSAFQLFYRYEAVPTHLCSCTRGQRSPCSLILSVAMVIWFLSFSQTRLHISQGQRPCLFLFLSTLRCLAITFEEQMNGFIHSLTYPLVTVLSCLFNFRLLQMTSFPSCLPDLWMSRCLKHPCRSTERERLCVSSTDVISCPLQKPAPESSLALICFKKWAGSLLNRKTIAFQRKYDVLYGYYVIAYSERETEH